MLFVVLGIIVVVGALLLIYSNFSTGVKRNLPHTAPPPREETPRHRRSEDDKVIYLFGASGGKDASDEAPPGETERADENEPDGGRDGS